VDKVVVPASQPPAETYSRARCLYLIIEIAALQLRQDADHLEQEDLALASRLTAILNQTKSISENDPLLK